MKINMKAILESVDCTVGTMEHNKIQCKVVRIKYEFPTRADDLWDAVTDINRLPLWFLPVSGVFKEGGHFQFEGNAGGKIGRCIPKSAVSVTWEFGGEVSWLDILVSPVKKKRSRLNLEHTVPINDHWKKYGPGATGVGWMFGLIGLAAHIDGYDFHGEGSNFDMNEFFQKPKTKKFIVKSSKLWAQADIRDGESEKNANAAAKETAAFYGGG